MLCVGGMNNRMVKFDDVVEAKSKSKRENILGSGRCRRKVATRVQPRLASHLGHGRRLVCCLRQEVCTTILLRQRGSSLGWAYTRHRLPGETLLVCATWTGFDLRQCGERTDGVDVSPLRMLDFVCVCPDARSACVFKLLLVQILDLDVRRGCAADWSLGVWETSRWRNRASSPDLERRRHSKVCAADLGCQEVLTPRV